MALFCPAAATARQLLPTSSDLEIVLGDINASRKPIAEYKKSVLFPVSKVLFEDYAAESAIVGDTIVWFACSGVSYIIVQAGLRTKFEWDVVKIEPICDEKGISGLKVHTHGPSRVFHEGNPQDNLPLEQVDWSTMPDVHNALFSASKLQEVFFPVGTLTQGEVDLIARIFGNWAHTVQRHKDKPIIIC